MINLVKPLYVVCDRSKVVSFPLPRTFAKKVAKVLKLTIRPISRRPLNWGIDQDQGL